jgi:hypothetical protein
VVFKPGQSGNPQGRIPGRKSAEFGTLLVLKAEQMSKPSVFLMNVYRDERVPVPLRIAAATAAAPYIEERAHRRNDCPISLPTPRNAAEARANISVLSTYMGTGQISLDVGEALINANKTLIEAFAVEVMEERLAILERQYAERPPDAKMYVLGGLPDMPGTNIKSIPHRHDEPPGNPWNGDQKDKPE